MNKLNRIWATIAIMLSCMLIPAGSSFAEDIDIYKAPESATGVGNPNILIILDNSANWADNAQHFPDLMQGEAELRAMRNVAATLNSGVNFGLMMFTQGSSANNPNGPGAYVRFKVRQMTQTSKSAFSELIGYESGCTDAPNSLNLTPNCIFKNFNSSDEKVGTSKTDYSAAMFEAFKYFGGYTSPAHAEDDVAGTPVDSSHFGALRYSGAPDAKSDRFAYQAAVGDTTPSVDANLTEYVTPIGATDNCAKNYIVVIGNGFPVQDSPASLLSGVGGDTRQAQLNNLTVQTQPSAWYEVSFTPCGTFATQAACESTLNDPNQTDLAIIAQYPLMSRDGTGYDSYRCTEVLAACPAGVPITESLGTSSCGAYSSSANCASALPSLFPGYDSYSCDTPTACSAVIPNPDAAFAPICTSQNLTTATNCNDFGAANYPAYSGFSCERGANCADGKWWTVTATNKTVSGNTYAEKGTRTLAVTQASFRVEGAMNVTAAFPDDTFYYPTTNNTASGTPTNEANYADEWARFLNKTDVSSATGRQNVTTFTIDVFKDRRNESQSKLLMSMAREGGGKYFTANNEDDITNALKRIMSEIQAVNSVFASSSLPVSVNTQGTYLNQVFMGMFRPDASSSPRWAGNLKQYHFKIFDGVLRLADKNEAQAISSTTGFITPCATSFWSTDTGTYWSYPGSEAIGDCTAITSSFPVAGSTSIYSDLPDGEVVEKGGAAQHLRGVVSSGGTLTASSQNYSVCTGSDTPETAQCRKLLTCNGSTADSCTSFIDFDTGQPTVTSALSASLINWVRGKDEDDENSNGNLNEVRPSVHGGVIHSQPAVVDYGGTTGVVAFYGADDGVFHAVKGNQSDSDGTELWGFIAPETYGRFARLRDNGSDEDGNLSFEDKVAFPADLAASLPWDAGFSRKDYFFDGSIGIYQKSGTVWLFAGMRRGGRAVYAFDASDPANPVLKWRRGCFTNDTISGSRDNVCSSGWSGIGQTWSKPVVAYLNGYEDAGGSPKPVVIFGGGYDQCDDTDSQTPCSGTRKGSQLWIVDADTGNVIRTYPTSASVPGDISLLTSSTGFATHIYVSDINGDIYRINVGTFDGTTLTSSSSDALFMAAGWSSNANYSTIEIARLSETNHARKFISGPNVVQYSGYNAVLIGSGDREHPLVGNYACNDYAANGASPIPGTYVTNQFYMIKDRPNAYPTDASGSRVVITPSNLTDVTSGTTTLIAADGSTQVVPFTEQLIGQNGWKFDFGPCEQSVNKPLTVAGTTYFGTHAPSPDAGSSCVANLGAARGYAVDFLTGNPATGNLRSAPFIGGGMPPSPVAGVVDVDGAKLPFIIGGVDTTEANVSALQGSKVEINPTGKRYRVFWYIQNE